MSSDEQSDKECPLCMEPFDFDDIHFYPCNCNYQICRFCWHRLRTDENGLCPACRQQYPEDPVNFQPLSSAEILKIKTEKRQKQQKNKHVDGKKPTPGLSAYRVLQKNLVYVIGLSQRMADSETLKKNEFFGKFGRIIKVAVGTAQNPNNIQPTSYTAYVTYGKTDDALRAIQAVNNLVVDGRLIKASLGTTKYCSNFLKGQPCHKQECMYLHDVADEELSFTKEDMHQGKHTECEKRLHEQMLNNQSQNVNSASVATSSTAAANNIGNINEHLMESNNRQKNVHKSLELDCDKPPPGFSKISQEIKNHTIILETTADLQLILQTKIAKKSENPKNYDNEQLKEANKNQNNAFIYADNNILVNENYACSHLDLNNFPETSSSASTCPPRSHSEPDKYEENFKLKYVPSDKNVMTCDELERILLGNSVPPGFQHNSINNIAHNGAHPSISGSYRKNHQFQMPTTQCYMDMGTSALQPQNFRESNPSSGGMNFFLDLYDDLGFDPFSESSKALADMLEEEKSTHSTN